MASSTTYYGTSPVTADNTEEMGPHYAGSVQATDYYPTPESVVHIGAHATHVTVHVHAYAPPPPAPPPVPTSSVDVDVHHEPAHVYTPNPRPTSPPSRPTPNHSDPPSEGSASSPRTTTTTRSVAATLSDTLAVLPDGLLSPTVQAVVQQVLRRVSEPSSSNTVVADAATTATRLGQRGQNVAISLMMQPLGTDGSTTSSLTDLFRQLNNGPDAPAAQGVPLNELNRHTEVVVHEAGRGLHDTCAVCQEPLESGQVVRRVLRCGHTFHHTCLDQWLEANATCPMCMQPVVPAAAVEGRAGADGNVGQTDGIPPPPPPPPPPALRRPPQRASSTTSATDREGYAYSPRTTAVVQQAEALLSRDEEEEEEEEDDDDNAPSRVHVRSVEVRRIPIRLWRTTTASDTGAETTTDAAPVSSTTTASRGHHSTVVDRILASALDELTLDTIEEDGGEEYGESDDGIAMV